MMGKKPTSKPTKKMTGTKPMTGPKSTDDRMAEQDMGMGMATVTRAKKPRSSKKAK